MSYGCGMWTGRHTLSGALRPSANLLSRRNGGCVGALRALKKSALHIEELLRRPTSGTLSQRSPPTHDVARAGGFAGAISAEQLFRAFRAPCSLGDAPRVQAEAN